MVENPWMGLPDKPPFIYPDDKEELQKVEKNHLALEVLPSPFVGPRYAPLVLLGNIAGRAKTGERPEWQKKLFVDRMRKCAGSA